MLDHLCERVLSHSGRARLQLRAEGGVDEGLLNGVPAVLEPAQPLRAEIRPSEVERGIASLAAPFDAAPDHQVVCTKHSGAGVRSAELVDDRVSPGQKDGARDRTPLGAGEKHEAEPFLKHALPEQPEEALWLDRHSQPTPRLQVQAVEDAVEIRRFLSPSDDDTAFRGSLDPPLHLRAPEAFENGIGISFQGQGVSKTTRLRTAPRAVELAPDLHLREAGLLLSVPKLSPELSAVVSGRQVRRAVVREGQR